MEATAAKQTSNIRWWDSLAALLLLSGLLTATGRLIVTGWDSELAIPQNLAMIGALLGLALGQSRFKPGWVIFFAFIYGVFLIPWQLGLSIHDNIIWKEKMLFVLTRLASTVTEFSRERQVSDNILFLSLMSLLFWPMGVHAGYSLTRYGQPWRAALPTGIALMAIHVYDPLISRRTWFLAAFLLFSMLMIARVVYLKRRHTWHEHRSYIPPDVGFDWLRFTLIVAVVLVIMAWTVPAAARTLPAAVEAWGYIKRPWDRFQDRVSNIFASLEAQVGYFTENYNESFTLGLGSELSDDPVMVVEAPQRAMPGVRYYWRAYVYDYYDNGKWTSTVDDMQLVYPDTEQELLYPYYNSRYTATFTFVPQYPIATFYTPSQPLWVSRGSNITFDRAPDGTIDVISMKAVPIVHGGQSYQVRSSITAANEATLRQAGTDYPEWISARYLQLPEEITPRTLELAQDIAGDLDNPYDIARAVTTYLRQYKYTVTIQAPPSDQELVDWWLFEYQEGFCQYYATAEVVLLRSLGIPARWAVGYAEGEFIGTDSSPLAGGINDPEANRSVQGSYLVRERDRHTWPEVYFPGIGWVEFEPTAGQSDIVRPSGERNNDASTTPNRPENDLAEEDRLQDLKNDRTDLDLAGRMDTPGLTVKMLTPYILSAVAIGLIVLALFAFRRRIEMALTREPLPVRLERGIRRAGFRPPDFLRRWAYYASLSPLTHAYLEINRALRLLGKPPAPTATPAERATTLAILLPAAETPVRDLVAQYQLLMYSQKSGDFVIARQAGNEIRKLSIRALLRSLLTGKQDHLGHLPD